MKRMRGRNHRQGGGGGGGGGSGGGGFRNQQNGIPLNRNHVFDSSGPEMRVRGTAQQLFDKYTLMARDAASSGDRVLGESYYQHAEHYFRIISAINQAQGVPNPPQMGQPGYVQSEGENEQPRQEQPRQEQQPRQDNPNRQEYRQDRPENRDNQNRDNQNRDNQNRDNPNRDNQNRDNRQDRRFDQRPRPEFQQRDRPFRQPQPPIADAPIDISAALEAELTAAVVAPPGLSEQPKIQHELMIPVPASEPRAIPIVTEAPPPLAAEEPAAPVRRPRGRPRLVKADAETPPE